MTDAIVASQFLRGAGTTLLNAMAADRRPIQQRALAAFLKQGMNYTTAVLQSYHAASPFMALKYGGTPLPIDAERMLETTVQGVAYKARNVVNDFISRGHVRPLPDIGVMTDVWQKESELGDASIGMGLGGGPAFDSMEFTSDGTPLPIFQKKFSFEERLLMASRRSNTPLDTRTAAAAAIKVAELEENTLINGATLQYNGLNLRGLATHPDTLTESTAKDFGTPANILDKFILCSQTFLAARMSGAAVYYISTVQYAQMLADHKAESDKSALSRVLELPGVEAVKHNQFVADGEMIGVIYNGVSADLAIAQNIITVPWEADGGALNNWRVFSCMAPRIMSDANGNVGVIRATGI